MGLREPIQPVLFPFGCMGTSPVQNLSSDSSPLNRTCDHLSPGLTYNTLELLYYVCITSWPVTRGILEEV